MASAESLTRRPRLLCESAGNLVALAAWRDDREVSVRASNVADDDAPPVDNSSVFIGFSFLVYRAEAQSASAGFVCEIPRSSALALYNLHQRKGLLAFERQL